MIGGEIKDMDFLDVTFELKSIRISLRSNSSSSTLYVEELPFINPLSTKVNILSVYFYFKGDSRFDVIGLINDMRDKPDFDFSQARGFILSKCSEIQGELEWSHSLKSVDEYSIKPKNGYKIFIKGSDFCGFCLWSSFFFLSFGRKICLSQDKESSRKLFMALHKHPGILKNKSYLFLIKFLNGGHLHYSGDK